MVRSKLIVSVVVVTLTPFSLDAQDAKTVLENAAETLGAAHLESVQYSGSGSWFRLGHSPSPGAPWSRYDLKRYTVLINYDTASRRLEAARTITWGEQHIVHQVSGHQAWNGASDTAWSAAYAVAERRLAIWMTPHGLIKAALANNASVKPQTIDGRQVREVSFLVDGKYMVTGIINDQNLVEKVSTWLGDVHGAFGVLGDTLMETTYSNYRDFDGLTFPTTIAQKQGGFPTLDVTVTDVQPNVPAEINVPRKLKTWVARADTEQVADGVWYVTGGQWFSVGVEFEDYLVVVEAPLTEERSIAVIAELKKRVPGKAIKYVVNTHHHFEHSGGIRMYAAEGATIVTHQINKPYYEKVFAAPRTLNPDRLARSKKSATFESFADEHVLTDGVRTMEVYHIQGSPHDAGIIMAYLPKEKLLIETDVYTPSPPNAPPRSIPDQATVVNFYENIQRLGLNVERIIPLHGRVVFMADLLGDMGSRE